MFVCELCNLPIRAAVNKDDDGNTRIIPPQPVRLVVERRGKVYAERMYKRGGITVVDPGGTGTEIVREVDACKSCVRVRGAA